MRVVGSGQRSRILSTNVSQSTVKSRHIDAQTFELKGESNGTAIPNDVDTCLVARVCMYALCWWETLPTGALIWRGSWNESPPSSYPHLSSRMSGAPWPVSDWLIIWLVNSFIAVKNPSPVLVFVTKTIRGRWIPHKSRSIEYPTEKCENYSGSQYCCRAEHYEFSIALKTLWVPWNTAPVVLLSQI